MGKDARLINIYLKIHHKRTLTMDDLAYLAQYDPECFEKTCENIVYKIPEMKFLMEPDIPETQAEEPASTSELFEWQSIEKILENLKRLEKEDFPVMNVDTDTVKSLLGNLYMEKLFPHNDKYAFVNMADSIEPSMFDQRA
ncbi:MAG: hypothetical protein NC543_16370 [bacterium]|nr:hypothetical protein [bacterium]MCM1376786.1 hypothetical protein [Muribaculum sp.]